MKATRLILTIVLWLVAVLLGYWLYKIINDRVKYEKIVNEYTDETVSRLKNIRIAQSAYLEKHGLYANNFDRLFYTINNDSIIQTKIIGNPDDTTVATVYEDYAVALKEITEFEGENFVLDSLRYIPNSGGVEFTLEADTFTQGLGNIVVPVYEVRAAMDDYLKGVPNEYRLKSKDLKLGSLTQATDAGNWE